MNKEDIIRKHFHGFSDQQWEEFKKEFPYCEIPFIVDDVLKEEKLTSDDKCIVESILLDASWVSRWTENKQAIYSVLTPEEAMEIVKDIFKGLDEAGYEIKRKDEGNYYENL